MCAAPTPMAPHAEASDAMVALWRDVTQRRQEALQVRQDAEELRRKLQSAEANAAICQGETLPVDIQLIQCQKRMQKLKKGRFVNAYFCSKFSE